MSVTIKDGDFILNGTSSRVVAHTLRGAGLSDVAVAEIVGGWFVGVTGAARPVPFDFTTDVQEIDPDCAITYSRDFTHVDWIDGESRVQAGLTPEELGFNARFHAIENEFDNIASQFTDLGRCVGGIRADLVGVVKELEAKITTLQNQIHALEQTKKPERPSLLGTTKIGDKEVFVTQFEDKFKFVDFVGRDLGDIGPRPVQPQPFDPRVMRPDELVTFTDGLRRTLDQTEVVRMFEAAQPVTVAELRTSPATSTVTLPTGEALGAVLADLPADLSFDTPGAVVSAVLDHIVAALPEEQAGEVRSTVVSGDALGRIGAGLLNSSVTELGLDADTSRALSAAGLNTIGHLAGADPKRVAGALSDAGVSSTVATSVVARAALARALRDVRHR